MFGARARTCRSTRSPDGAATSPGKAVRSVLPRTAPNGLSPRRRRSTWQHGTEWPSAPLSQALQDRADRLDPELLAVLVDERDQRGCGRSSAEAKKADAFLKVLFERRSSNAWRRARPSAAGARSRSQVCGRRRPRPASYSSKASTGRSELLLDADQRTALLARRVAGLDPWARPVTQLVGVLPRRCPTPLWLSVPPGPGRSKQRRMPARCRQTGELGDCAWLTLLAQCSPQELGRLAAGRATAQG